MKLVLKINKFRDMTDDMEFGGTLDKISENFKTVRNMVEFAI